VVKLVDALDSKSSGPRDHVGSIPTSGTIELGRASVIALALFLAALDSNVDEDRIKISGQPNLNVVLKGTHGDVATRSIAVNAIRRVKEVAPGLVTMRDLPIVSIG
jgi:hypothetical protein